MKISSENLQAVVDTALDDLFGALDAYAVTSRDLRDIGEGDLAEWFETWLEQ